MTGLSFFKAKNVSEGSILMEMDADIAVNENGLIMMMHSAAFSPELKHIEYDPHKAELLFVDIEGGIKPFGMKVPKQTRAKIDHASKAGLFQMTKEKKICNFKTVEIRRQNNGSH